MKPDEFGVRPDEFGPSIEWWHDLLLQRLKFRSSAQVSRLAMMQHVNADVMLDEVSQRVLLTLEGEVLAEKLLTDTAEIPFHTTVAVPQPEPHYAPALLAFTMAAALSIASVFTGWLLGLAAVLMFVVGVVAIWHAEPSGPHELPVTGRVGVDATYYATFPENTMPYPDDLGPVVRKAILGSPTVYDTALA